MEDLKVGDKVTGTFAFEGKTLRMSGIIELLDGELVITNDVGSSPVGNISNIKKVT